MLYSGELTLSLGFGERRYMRSVLEMDDCESDGVVGLVHVVCAHCQSPFPVAGSREMHWRQVANLLSIDKSLGQLL